MKRLSVKSPVDSLRISVGDSAEARQPFAGARVRQALLDEDGNPTCLSALPHVPNADRDSLFQHFLGCLEFRQRADFLDENNEFWTQRVEDEIARLSAGKAAKDLESLRHQAEVLTRKNIQAFAVSLEAQYKRTAMLRRALSRENPSTEWNPDAPGDDIPEPKSLVGYIDQSRAKWRQSFEYRNGMEKVQEWRRKHGLPIDSMLDTIGERNMEEAGRAKVQEIVGALRGHNSMTEKITGYNLEQDVNAHFVQYTRLKSADAVPKASAFDPKMRHLPVTSYEEDLMDHRFKGKFPDQCLSVDSLLKDPHTMSEYRDIISNGAGRNILSKDDCDKRDPTRMRYLHIPVNNMEWVEVRSMMRAWSCSLRHKG